MILVEDHRGVFGGMIIIGENDLAQLISQNGIAANSEQEYVQDRLDKKRG